MEHVYRSYYTDSDHIRDYMLARLKLADQQHVLEPCAGHGAFISSLLNRKFKLKVDALDLNPEAISTLKERFAGSIRVRQADFLLADLPDASFDRIVGNPPYGGWQDPARRKQLKKTYPGLYVRETYAMFLFRAITLLREGGRLCFITPDTYLNLHRHSTLRRFILENTRIIEIATFPSSFFPGVSFGYSKLAIITLQRCSKRAACLANSLLFKSDYEDPADLVHDRPRVALRLRQGALLENPAHAFLIDAEPRVWSLIQTASIRIGDVADCVTGIYTGNDKIYLRPAHAEVKRARNYLALDASKVYRSSGSPPPLEGINDVQCFVPLAKGGAASYQKPDLWFIDWSTAAVAHYRQDRKARFQNSRYYFKQGVAVPMVSSGRVCGWLLNHRIFDQSIVGIFPKDARDLLVLLAFFNSAICTRLVRTINPSANNSANYIKKVPWLSLPSADRREVERSVRQILASNASLEAVTTVQARIDDIFENAYGLATAQSARIDTHTASLMPTS